jgi:hypothetical protein
MDESSTSLNRAELVLTDAAQQMQGGTEESLHRADALVGQAQTALDRAAAAGAERVKLHAANEQRLSDLESRAQGMDAAIERGATAFDQVDDFAESTWNDIRGNGSSAEAAAHKGRQHLLAARQRNTMERQQFEQASAALDAAERAFDRALSLVQAIEQRLSELQEARDTAHDELRAAAADIAQGREFVRKHDPDIGKVPERTLDEAQEALEQAQAQAAKPQPDWLELVRSAQRANALADEALAQARSEVETANKLRQSVRRAAQTATADIQRAERFLTANINEMSIATRQAVQELQQRARGEDGVLRSAAFDGLSPTRLQQMQQAYMQLAEDAEHLYQTMQQEHQAAAAARERRRREARERQRRNLMPGGIMGAGGVIAGSRRRHSRGGGINIGGSSGQRSSLGVGSRNKHSSSVGSRSGRSSVGSGSRSGRSSFGGGSSSGRSSFGSGSRSKRRGW